MQKSKGTQTILWWVAWITLTIVSFFVAAAFWTPLIARHFGSIRQTRASVWWLISVFGTWMIFLVPLIVFMYQKVDKAYEDARINREKRALAFRSISVDASKRTLAASVTAVLAGLPETIDGGHLVTASLKDSRIFDYVFIQNRSQILGIYDQTEMPFCADDVASIQPSNLNNLPVFNANRWLRLDGITQQS